ncbi:MAG: hypothetical protein IPN68_13460 [Bacteroidetes bacterium]|nr:hypothetical protein [Bacteroidota bacterium]
MRKIILIAIILISCSFACFNNKEKQTNKVDSKSILEIELSDIFQTYWKDFREAVINSDSLKLLTLTNFPLKSHGVMDSDPQILINSKNFYYYFQICLNEETGMSINFETNLDFIKKIDKITDYKFYTKNREWQRINQMEFQKINNYWRLTLIYFDTADYK